MCFRKTIQIFLFAFLFISSPCLGASVSKPYLFLGNENLSPLVFIEHGKPEGLVVDIVKAMADRAEMDIEVKAVNWRQAQDMVDRDEADALIQINKSSDREKKYEFSNLLLKSSFTIFCRNDRRDIREIKSLYGCKVGVEASGYPIELIRKHKEIKIHVIGSWKEGFDLVNSGEIDAIVADRWTGEYNIFVHNIQNIVSIEEPVETGSSYIAVKKGNKKLLEKINSGLSIIRSDGTFDRILSKWDRKNIVYVTKEKMSRFNLIFFLSALNFIFLVLVIVYAWLLHKAKKKAELLSSTDSLTDIPNRRSFYIAGERELISAKRYRRPISVIQIDIDSFKQINDRWGHGFGDRILKAAADTIKNSVRARDIYARMGGDEFTLLLPETDAQQVRVVAERIRNAIAAQEIASGGEKVGFSVSVGIATDAQDWSSLDHLIARADKALYQSKESGRNQVN